MDWIVYYFIAINIFGLLIMGWDKMKARTGAWRIPENSLLLAALAGGSIGVYLGLILFRHKSRHLKFSVGVPVIFLIQVGIVYWFFRHGLDSGTALTRLSCLE